MNYDNPHKVTHELDEYGERTGVSFTAFERAVDAAATTLLAAAYPSDKRIREQAIQACHWIDIDYLGAIAVTWEKLNQDIDTARFSVAEAMGDIVRHMLSKGAEPRQGILTNGRPANALGEPEDDYGSLA